MKSLIPVTTTPLTKFIRTLEGWIVVVVNGVLIVVPIVTNALPATFAVKYGAIFNMVVLASRSALKAIASLGAAGLTPIEPNGVPAGLEGKSAATVQDYEQGPSPDDLPESVVDTSELDKEGTPVDQIQSAGAPDSVTPGPGSVASPPVQS